MASGQALLKATVPGDGDCLLYSITIAVLTPKLFEAQYWENFSILFPETATSDGFLLHDLLAKYVQSGCVGERSAETSVLRPFGQGRSDEGRMLTNLMDSLRCRIIGLMEMR